MNSSQRKFSESRSILDMPISDRFMVSHTEFKNICVRYSDGILAWIDANGNTIIETVDKRRDKFKAWHPGTYNIMSCNLSLEEATLHWLSSGGTLD